MVVVEEVDYILTKIKQMNFEVVKELKEIVLVTDLDYLAVHEERIPMPVKQDLLTATVEQREQQKHDEQLFERVKQVVSLTVEQHTQRDQEVHFEEMVIISWKTMAELNLERIERSKKLFNLVSAITFLAISIL